MGGASSMLENLEKRRVLLCVGPGGVGKTTCAAAIALRAAAAGRKVVVITIDPSRRLGQALGLDPAHPPLEPVEVPARGDGSLHALVLDPKGTFDHIVHACSRDPQAADTITENPIYRATAQHLGGAVEYAAMARVQMLCEDPRFDLIVLDTPPTANAIDFIEAPSRIREIVQNPAARLLTGTGRIGMKILGLGGGVVLKALEGLGGGVFLKDLSRFLREFADVLAEFQRRAGDFESLLTDPSTGTLLTTSPAAFSVREAVEFLNVLTRAEMQVDGVILNRVAPALPKAPTAAEIKKALQAGGASASPDRIRALQDLYAGLEAEGERGDAAVRELRVHHRDVSVGKIPRLATPPTTLDELRDMGESIQAA